MLIAIATGKTSREKPSIYLGKHINITCKSLKEYRYAAQKCNLETNHPFSRHIFKPGTRTSLWFVLEKAALWNCQRLGCKTEEALVDVWILNKSRSAVLQLGILSKAHQTADWFYFSSDLPSTETKKRGETIPPEWGLCECGVRIKCF